MYKIIICLPLLLLSFGVFSQSEPLRLISKEEPVLGSKGVVTAVAVVSEREKYITIRVEFKGFEEEGYLIKAEVLGKGRMRISSVASQEQILAQGNQQVELTFSLYSENKGKALELRYLSLSICKKDGLLRDLGIQTDAYTYIYQLERKREAEGIMVKVDLMPYPSSRQLPEPVRGLNRNNAINKPDAKADTLDLERKGPANLPYEFMTGLKSEYEFASSQEIINIFGKIYRDANPHSGYFYYLPASYHLNWSPERGYALYINYLKSEGSGLGEVAVTAELKPNISKKDLEMAEALLLADLVNDPNPTFRKLVSMPLAAPPAISMLQLTNFGVQPQDINIQAPTDFLQPIGLSWKMKNVEDLQTALINNLGLSGNMRMQPTGEMPELVLPVNIGLDDHHTFGHLELDPARWRNQTWLNPTPLPLLLKNVHIMVMEPVHGLLQPRIYSWNLGEVVISRDDTVKFNAALAPVWIDRHPNVRKIWIEYAVQPCPHCEVFIIAPPPSDNIRLIEFTVMNPLAFTGAQQMKIRIRSHQAGNSAHGKTELPPITITSDGETIPAGRLLVPDGQGPEFEYLIQLYMPDGKKYIAPYWQSSRDTDVSIGSFQIKQLFPEFER